jgi:putative MFS transporter
VPILLIAKAISVTKTLEYTFIIAFAYPLFPLLGTWFADRIERKWQVCLSCTGIAVFVIAWLLGRFGVPAVFLFVAAAMAIVVIGVGAQDPRTNNLGLEDISH